MAQQDIDGQQRSAIRTGGIALICLGALLAGVVVTMNSGDAPRRELRANTDKTGQYMELGLVRAPPSLRHTDPNSLLPRAGRAHAGHAHVRKPAAAGCDQQQAAPLGNHLALHLLILIVW